MVQGHFFFLKAFCDAIKVIDIVFVTFSYPIYFFNVYLFLREREREHKQGRNTEKEGDTESEACFRLWAVSAEPDVGLEPMSCEFMTWVEVRCLTDWATQVPHLFFFFNVCLFWERECARTHTHTHTQREDGVIMPILPTSWLALPGSALSTRRCCTGQKCCILTR